MSPHRALRAFLLLAVGCQDDSIREGKACMNRPDSGECPPASEVDPDQLWMRDCDAAVLTVEGSRDGDWPCAPTDLDTGEPHPGCWYDVTYKDRDNDCEYGRPFATSASPADRDDWHSPATGLAEDPDRAGEWTAIALALARDESNHAALAWRTLKWALAIGGEPVGEAVRAALAEAPRDDAWLEVVAPVARAILPTYS